MVQPLDRLDVHAQLVGAFEPRVNAIFEALSAPTSESTLLQLRERRARRRLAEALALRLEPDLPEPWQGELKALVSAWKNEGFDDAFSGIAAFEVSRAREGDLVWASQHGEAELLDTLERQYREAVVARYGTHELRGLQTSTRVLQQLDLIYVPLHAEGDVISVEGEDELLALLRERERVSIPALLAREPVVMLVGAPGSGKSTVCAWVASQVAVAALSELAALGELLPLLVPVRSLSKLALGEAEIAAVTSCDQRVVRRALESGRVFLIIDGIDEAQSDVNELWVALDRLRAEAPSARVLVTTRPRDNEDTGRAGVHATRLLPMTLEEVKHFVEKWCLAAELSVRSDRSQVEAQVEGGKAAADLVRRIEQSRAVARLAENPLMCSVICTVHRFMGQRIPERRTALYEACTNVLLYEWDRAKFPDGAVVGRLDAPAKRAVLGGLALAMHEANAAEWPEDAIRTAISERLPGVGEKADGAARFLDEVRFRSGLVVERRPGVFAFSHLTFQEYLASVEIVAQQRTDWLVEKHADPHWHEVIVLAAGLPGAPVEDMISGLLKRKDNDTGLFLAAQCLDAAAAASALIRARVEIGLAQVLPPKTRKLRHQLASCPSSAVGPVLLRLLVQSSKPRDTSSIIWCLWAVRFEPAIGEMVRKALEEERRNSSVRSQAGAVGWLSPFIETILVFWSRESRLASDALRSLDEERQRSKSPAAPGAPPPNKPTTAPARAPKQVRGGPKRVRQSAPSRP